MWMNVSTTVATFLSPTSLACLSPPYHRVGLTTLSINTTFNSSLYVGGGETAQTAPFTYYDKRRPPDLFELRPTHAPTHGRPLHIVGDWDRVDHGHWEDYGRIWDGSGADVTGGVLLLGENFAPTHFLWCARLRASAAPPPSLPLPLAPPLPCRAVRSTPCTQHDAHTAPRCAFGLPAGQTTTRGPWTWVRGVYINGSAIRCEVPPNQHGRWFETAAPHPPPEHAAPSASLDPSEGPGRSYAPRSAASAAWRLYRGLGWPASALAKVEGLVLRSCPSFLFSLRWRRRGAARAVLAWRESTAETVAALWRARPISRDLPLISRESPYLFLTSRLISFDLL